MKAKAVKPKRSSTARGQVGFPKKKESANSGPLSEDEERFFIHSGRRWRKTDPSIPSNLRTSLVNELMAARRAVKTALRAADAKAERAARTRVQDAKVALGERGAPWWETPTDTELAHRLQAAILALLRSRRDGATICPSEAARIACQPNWRDHMDLTTSTARILADAGVISVRQKGKIVSRDVRGAIRLQLESGRPSS